MQKSAGSGEPRTPSSSPVRRPRAPTITIDTSQVGVPVAEENYIPLQIVSNGGLSTQGESRAAPSSTPLGIDGAPELRMSSSFESIRPPTSPHNVSSPPATWGDSRNYLAVPGARQRGDSFDSDAAHSGSTLGGETYATTPSATSDGDRRKSLDPSSTTDLLNNEDALKPDPGTEESFDVDDNKFAFSPGQLSKLMNPKSLSAFYALGGLAGLEKGLRTSCTSGLSVDEQYLEGQVTFEEAVAASTDDAFDSKLSRGRTPGEIERTITAGSSKKSLFADRLRIFKDNRLPERKTKSIFQLMWLAFTDKVLILLSVAAVVSLALGIYQTVGQPHKNGEASVEWVEGVAIMVAIMIVVMVGALNDYQKERQFVKLNKKKEDRSVKVIRSGRTQEISVYDVLVGEVVLLEPGDLAPVDGIFIEGQSVTCDESSATGESDLLKKRAAIQVFRALEQGQSVRRLDPFILSGSKVTEGVGRFLVTAVGVNSTYGQTMMSLREDSEVTPLQSKLNIMAEYIAKLGGAAALFYFVVAFIEFLVRINGNDQKLSSAAKGQQFLNIFIIAVSVVVVAVPEGLPLAVTLALAFATTRMLKDNNLVRLLRSCETMGNATTVCSDKTGTLTENKMTVVAGILGTAMRFGDQKALTTKSKPPPPANQADEPLEDQAAPDKSVQEFVSVLDHQVKFLLEQSIAINTTAFEAEEDGIATFTGSKTETALLSFARDYLGMGPLNVERANAKVVQSLPFDSGRKCMGVVMELEKGVHRMYVKGASEIMLEKCTKIISDPAAGVTEMKISKSKRDSLNKLINTYASRSLRTIGFLYKDFKQWPPRGVKRQSDDPSLAVFEDAMKDMTFLAVFGIQDPLRAGVAGAVADCKKAGVFVRMVTGDNKLTAQAIAEECGIFTPGGVIMEGPDFRKLNGKEMDAIIPRLQVLARSSPDDKKMLVRRLKDLGETVAVTGDGTNDAPALKTADVGFSMGISGTEVAKEASAIILMDDNFASIVKALKWGRAVNDAVKKFLQFQITVNITAVILTFVSGVSNGSEQSILSAVQLLWVNLIMDTFAALALATDPPAESIINRKPDSRKANLISLTMWKQIIGQAIYQLVVTFVLYYRGAQILSYQSVHEQHQLRTLVFNVFVWMQIFNAFNNRRLDNHFNILEGIQRNWYFIGIIGIMVGGQTVIVTFGGAAFGSGGIRLARLNGAQWGYSLVLGALTIPIGAAIRMVPDELIRALTPEYLKRAGTPTVVIDDEEARRYEWNPALLEIREELAFLKKFRGGRLNALRFKIQHPREFGILPRSSSAHSRSRSSTNTSLPQSPSAESNDDRQLSPSPAVSPSPKRRMRGRSRSSGAFGPAAVMAGVIAGSIAGWSPIERTPGDGESRFTRSLHDPSRSDLGDDGVDVHPDTRPDDPIITHASQLSPGVPPSQSEATSPDFGAGLMAASHPGEDVTDDPGTSQSPKRDDLA